MDILIRIASKAASILRMTFFIVVVVILFRTIILILITIISISIFGIICVIIIVIFVLLAIVIIRGFVIVGLLGVITAGFGITRRVFVAAVIIIVVRAYHICGARRFGSDCSVGACRSAGGRAVG